MSKNAYNCHIREFLKACWCDHYIESLSTMSYVIFEHEKCISTKCLVWFMLDEYYSSETTTTQACLGYVCKSRLLQSSEGQPCRNSYLPFDRFALHTPSFM